MRRVKPADRRSSELFETGAGVNASWLRYHPTLLKQIRMAVIGPPTALKVPS